MGEPSPDATALEASFAANRKLWELPLMSSLLASKPG